MLKQESRAVASVNTIHYDSTDKISPWEIPIVVNVRVKAIDSLRHAHRRPRMKLIIPTPQVIHALVEQLGHSRQIKLLRRAPVTVGVTCNPISAVFTRVTRRFLTIFFFPNLAATGPENPIFTKMFCQSVNLFLAIRSLTLCLNLMWASASAASSRSCDKNAYPCALIPLVLWHIIWRRQSLDFVSRSQRSFRFF